MKVRGLVMEIRGDCMVILSREGEFRRLPIPRRIPRVGEEIEIEIGRKGGRYPAAAAAAALLLLALGGAFLQVQSFLQPVSYLGFDINPSLGLYLDAGQQVIRSEGLNQEGADLLDAVPVKGMKLPTALEGLVKEAVARDYIRTGSDNVILTAVVPLRDKDMSIELEAVVAAVNSGLDPEHLAFVAAQRAEPGDLATARREEVSLNRHLMQKRGRARGKELSPPALEQGPPDQGLLLELLAPEGWAPGEGQVAREAQGHGVVRLSEGVVVSGPPGKLTRIDSDAQRSHGGRPEQAGGAEFTGGRAGPGQPDKKRGVPPKEQQGAGGSQGPPEDTPGGGPARIPGLDKIQRPGQEKKGEESESISAGSGIPPGLRGKIPPRRKGLLDNSSETKAPKGKGRGPNSG